MTPSMMQAVCLPTRIFDRTEDLERTRDQFDTILDSTDDNDVCEVLAVALLAMEKALELCRKAHVMSMHQASLLFVQQTEKP